MERKYWIFVANLGRGCGEMRENTFREHFQDFLHFFGQSSEIDIEKQNNASLETFEILLLSLFNNNIVIFFNKDRQEAKFGLLVKLIY